MSGASETVETRDDQHPKGPAWRSGVQPKPSKEVAKFKEVGYEEGGTAIVKGARGSKILNLVKKLGNGQWQCKDGDKGMLKIVNEADMSPATKL